MGLYYEPAITLPHVLALHIRSFGTYSVSIHDAAQPEIILDHYCAVVDDFGELVPAMRVNLAQDQTLWPSFDHEIQAMERLFNPAPTRPHPEPVTVEITPDEFGFLGRPLTEIRIGRDERSQLSAAYVINVA